MLSTFVDLRSCDRASRDSRSRSAMRDVRPSAVAGSWYPAAATRCSTAVDAHLASAAPRRGQRAARARSSRRTPGLMYSGPVAAYAYALVRQCHYSAVVLVGPVAFRRLSRRVDLAARRVGDAARRRGGRRRAGRGDRRRVARDRRASGGARARAFARDAAAVRRAPAAGCADRAARDGIPDRGTRRWRSAMRSRAPSRRTARATGRRAARGQQRPVALRGCRDGLAAGRRRAAARRGARRRRA